jgi:Mg2+/Co2+ transporter CorB
VQFSNEFLIGLLIFLVGMVIFFSLAETAMLSVNRYRLRHLVRKGHALASHVQQLLEAPDRLLGVILLGATFVNIAAASVATMLAIHLYGQGVLVTETFITTFVILILGEVAPKTLAALYPQHIAFVVVWPLLILLKIFYPLVWAVNFCANTLLRLLGVRLKKNPVEHLSREELASVLHETGGRVPPDYQIMLLKVLSLEKATVEDIMIPRHEMIGIDLNESWDDILEQLTNSQHTRLILYKDSFDDVLGMIHLRKVLNLLANEKLNKTTLLEAAESLYFVPENTPLNVQLINFRHEKRRSGLVVNEYGDIQGLVTLEDILEEIVGEFTTDMVAMTSKMIHPQTDGSYLVDGSINIRDLNRLLSCHFTTTGPRTLSGLITEYLEMIPPANTALRLADYPMEVIQVKDNMIKTVRILPKL